MSMTKASCATGWRKTAGVICSLNCGLEVQTEGRCIVRIRGAKAHPASQVYVCEKSQRMDRRQNGADRLDSPLRRRPDGSHERIDRAAKERNRVRGEMAAAVFALLPRE